VADERWPATVASTLNAHFGDKMGLEDQHALNGAALFVPVVTNALTNNNGQRNEVSDMVNGLIVDQAATGQPIPFDTTQITSAENRSNPRAGDPMHPIPAHGHAPAIAIQAGALRENPESGPDGVGVRDDGAAYTIEVQAVAFDSKGTQVENRQDGVSPTLRSMNAADSHANGGGQLPVALGWRVRRLTPVECERLMGMQDGYTQIPRGNKPTADGPRYKALGNSWAVNCARVIGERIAMFMR
jgi:DNA (cytosine-5)-methyltransferase 1